MDDVFINLIKNNHKAQEVIRLIVMQAVEQVELKHNPVKKEFLSYREAALLLDVKVATIRRKANEGIYQKYYPKHGGKPYLKREEIIEGFK